MELHFSTPASEGKFPEKSPKGLSAALQAGRLFRKISLPRQGVLYFTNPSLHHTASRVLSAHLRVVPKAPVLFGLKCILTADF